MSSKAGKMTAGKARERIDGLQESITSRRHRLEQLRARLERSDVPDERLMAAKSRLERRIEQEEEQLEKLLRLLDLQDEDEPEESSDFEADEEIEDLHRSFEEIRQNVAQLQTRINSNPEIPRDLDGRLSTCESRISRREAVDSELFARVMSLQTALDQERQAARRLTRRLKDQEQSMEALREAVEDAFVTNVDLAQRVEELAELSAADESLPQESSEQPWLSVVEELRASLAEAENRLEQLHQFAQESFQSAALEREGFRDQLERTSKTLELGLTRADADSRLALLSQSCATTHSALLERLERLEEPPTSPPQTVDLSQVWQRLESLEGQTPPTLEPSELWQRLEKLENWASPGTDLSELWLRLKSLEEKYGSVRGASPEASSSDGTSPATKPIPGAVVIEAATQSPALGPVLEVETEARNRAVFASSTAVAGRKLAVFGARRSRFR